MKMVDFIGEFRRAAHQLNSYQIAGRWARLAQTHRDLTPEEAARWADLGFHPEEALPHIEVGITARRYREMEDYAAERAGGADALAARRIQRMLDAGELVQGVRDPFDPDRTILP